MGLIVKVYASEKEASKQPSEAVKKRAYPYQAVMQMSMKQLSEHLNYWMKREAELSSRKANKTDKLKLERRVIQVNIHRLAKRYNVLKKKLPHPDKMPVDSPGKTYRCVSPLPWAVEERLEEEFFLKERDKRIEELVKLIQSDNLIKVEIQFRDNGAYFEFLKNKQVIREEKVSELMTMTEAREILRAGTESFLGRAFRALLSRSDWK